MSEERAVSDRTYRLDEQIGFKLRVANQKHLEIFSAAMSDLTPRQFAVLAKLLEQGTLSQNHLGRQVAMDAATTKGVIERLLRKGYVTSTPSATDRRRLDIALTDEGTAAAQAAIGVAQTISERTSRNLTERELHRLLALLDKL
jgi:MarR family transcriptional regulator, lower aerobic nicotinate degradation pathway regulator